MNPRSVATGDNVDLVKWVGLGISVLAIVATGINLYFNFFRDIRMQIRRSSNVYVANSIGALPRLRVQYGFIVTGPSGKHVTIDQITARISRISPKMEWNLVTAESVPLPIEVKGDQSTSINLEFGYENTSRKVDQIGNWGDDLLKQLKDPDDLAIVNSAIASAKAAYFEPSRQPSLLVSSLSAAGFFAQPASPQASPKKKIETIIQERSFNDILKDVFFVQGDYSVQIDFYSGQREVGKADPIAFTISEGQGKRLLSAFDQWTLLIVP
ncbi:MAG: hypothetical protein ABIJ37_05745 [Pseudomonadota bacterium]